jgi:hypothetical protein
VDVWKYVRIVWSKIKIHFFTIEVTGSIRIFSLEILINYVEFEKSNEEMQIRIRIRGMSERSVGWFQGSHCNDYEAYGLMGYNVM